MKRTLIGVAAIWSALLLAAGPARAQVGGSDCRAEQAAMRELGAPDAAVREALLPPGVESADTTADALGAMRDAYRDALSTAQAAGAKEDAATFRLMICAYGVAIARRQGPSAGTIGSMASASTGGGDMAAPSSGPLPSGQRWGNAKVCLKIEKLQRGRFQQETGKIFDVINFVLRNECPVDQLYYLNFGGPESSYVSPEFTNRKFQQDAMAAPNSAFLPDPAPMDFRPLLRQPPAHTPNPQAFVQVARAGKTYHMEVSAGEADSLSSPYWSPKQYVIAACDVTRGGYPVRMFFNPNQNYFDCIPKTDGAAR